MAQHIPIEKFRQKVFKKIENAIKKDFTNPYIKGSLKYEFDRDRFYSENENDEVYHTERYIGEGFVWGDTRGSFEVHFDKVKKKVTEIYLVA